MQTNFAIGMPRVQDWPERLSAYIVASLPRPHAWGSHDCVTFARGAVQAVTGGTIDLPALWTDQATAERALAALGGLAAAVDTVLTRHASVHQAQRGDIALVCLPGRDPWIAVIFDGLVWAPTATGLASCPIAMATAVWKV